MKVKLSPGGKGWDLLEFLAKQPEQAKMVAKVWRASYPDDPSGWATQSATIHGKQEPRGEAGRAVKPVGEFDDLELYRMELLNSVDSPRRAAKGLIESDRNQDGSLVKPIRMGALKAHRGDWVKDQIIENLREFWADSRAKRNALPTLRRLMDFQRTDGGLNRLGVGIKRLAADLEAGEKTIKRHLKTLLDDRILILWQKGNNLKRKVNQYILNVDRFVIRPKSDPLLVNIQILTYLASFGWDKDPHGFQKLMDEAREGTRPDEQNKTN